jgi:hypothetical protein
VAVHTTTTTNFGANVLFPAYLEGQFISALENRLVAVPLGVKSTLPDNMGKTVRWQYLTSPSAASANTEGTTLTDESFTTTTATATLAEYGQQVPLSRLLIKTAVSGTLEEIVNRMAYGGALTFDTVALNSIDGSSTTVDSGAALTLETIRSAVTTLEASNVLPHRDSPGGQYYCGIFTSSDLYDMMGEGAPVWFQAKSEDFRNSLVTPFRETPASAAVYNVIFKRSNNIQTSGGDNLNVLFGDEAFGVAAIDNDITRPRMFITSPDETRDIAYPHRNVGTVAWLGFFAAVLFDNTHAIVVHADT